MSSEQTPIPYPGPQSAEVLLELEKYVVAEPYPFVVDLDRCEGAYMCTLEGQKIFDWHGCFASKLIEYNHPRLSEPEYLKKIVRAANNKMPNPDMMTLYCLEYYRLLHRIAPKCMRNPRLEVYAINSGAEAIENMLKYFVKLHDQKCKMRGINPAKRRLLHFEQAFHGRTVFCLNVTEQSHDPMITNNFRGFIPDNIKVPFPYINTDEPHEANVARMNDSLALIKQMLEEYGDEIVGIIAEPFQGAGGHRVALPEFFREMSKLAHEYGVPYGFDEVQTSGGQCGELWACDLMDLPYPPHAIATAKKFGNGVVYMLFPLDEIGVLDSTWGGNLVDMLRFKQEWRIIEDEKLIEQVPEKTEQILAGLRMLQAKYPDKMENIRGYGLFQGFSIKKPYKKGKFIDNALDHENLFLLGAAFDAVRLRSCLSVTKADIALLIEKFDRLLANLEA